MHFKCFAWDQLHPAKAVLRLLDTLPSLPGSPPRAMRARGASHNASTSVPRGRRWGSVHRVELFVQVIRGEIRTVVPGDRREAVVEIEIGEPRRIAQELEMLSIQIVRQIDHTFPAIVELEPNLVIAQVSRFDH